MDVQMELDEGGEVAENIYNAWLPVAQESKSETQRFHDVVGLLQSGWREDYMQTRFATLKWIPVIATWVDFASLSLQLAVNYHHLTKICGTIINGMVII